MQRVVVRSLVVIIVVAAAAGVAAWFYLRQSLPLVDGTVTVAGISGPVDIVRDADAIPHILASSKRDAFFGLGYVHAQDRLWQMEFQRRIGHGRLSEIFGAVALPQDRFLRTVGFGRAAHTAWAHLPDKARSEIEAYVAGVNAFIDTHRGRGLPPEFTLLRFAPEPFTGADVLAWVKMMAWDLSANYSVEMMRHDIEARVGHDRAAELLPPYPEQGLSIVGGIGEAISTPAAAPASASRTTAPARPAATAISSWASALASSLASGDRAVTGLLLGGQRNEALGSNNWVVDSTMTASGKPMLASDPHLATKVPSLWYLAHMSAGDFDVIGATLPGTPAVAIGRNRDIAWGETNVAADVEDLFLERLDASGQSAEFQGTWEPIRTIVETITVKGADPVRVDVRITRHGPLVSDAINANNAASKTDPTPAPLEPLAFRWTALDDRDSTIVSFLKLNEARNWDEFTTALRDFDTPAQNFVYADVNGHIGYYAPGRIPVRKSGDGSRPVEGWTGAAEWIGWIPFEELPHAFDPPNHFIVTANNRPMPAAYPHLVGSDYPNPYRAERITELLTAKRGLTPNDFRDIQVDTASLHAKALLPALLAQVASEEPATRRALELLRQWSFDGRGDSGAEAVFQAWFLKLAPALVGDELGPQALAAYAGRFSSITRLVTGVLSRGSSPWCDNVNTPAQESCRDVVTTALVDAVADLEKRMGSDIGRWRWDGVHRAVFPHQGLDAVGLLRPILSRSMPNGGDWSTVNVGPVAAGSPYDQTSIPGYRQIVDLSPANDSRFLDAVGQSGHVLSRHYDDFLADWQTVRHRRMRMDRPSIEDGAIGRLRLLPH
jgi:penicillin amidase